MKHVSLILAFVLTFTSTLAFAEPKVFIRSNGQFVGNGNEYPRGFWIPAIQGADDVFAGDPIALQEYHDHLEGAKWFGILNWGALGLFATYAIISSSNDNYNSGAGLIIFLVPWIGGVVMATKSNRHLLKAINIVNGVPPAQAQLSLTPEPQRYSLAKPLQIPLLAWTF